MIELKINNQLINQINVTEVVRTLGVHMYLSML